MNSGQGSPGRYGQLHKVSPVICRCEPDVNSQISVKKPVFLAQSPSRTRRFLCNLDRFMNHLGFLFVLNKERLANTCFYAISVSFYASGSLCFKQRKTGEYAYGMVHLYVDQLSGGGRLVCKRKISIFPVKVWENIKHIEFQGCLSLSWYKWTSVRWHKQTSLSRQKENVETAQNLRHEPVPIVVGNL